MPEQRFSGYRSSSCSRVVVRPCGVCQSVGRGQLLGEDIQDRGFRPDLICGPAIGGVICAQYVALALKARCVFVERVFDDAGKTERFEIKRGYDEIV